MSCNEYVFKNAAICVLWKYVSFGLEYTKIITHINKQAKQHITSSHEELISKVPPSH